MSGRGFGENSTCVYVFLDKTYFNTPFFRLLAKYDTSAMVVEMKCYSYANVVAENCAKVHVTRPAPYSTDEIPNLFLFSVLLNCQSRKPSPERDNIGNDHLCLP